MPRTKHKKIAEAKAMPNILDYRDPDFLTKLNNILIQHKTIILELACGDGQYALEMAEIFPEKFFIGVDIQGERLWMGAKTERASRLNNIIFLRAHIDHLDKIFSRHSIEEIWLTFPDPYPRKKQIRKRLTSTHFLAIYKQILRPKGILHLKTDNDGLFDYSTESIAQNGGQIKVCIQNIDQQLENHPLLKIQTYFERKNRKLGKTIHYLNCTL